MNNEPYYGVTRTDEYLAHYGIKGMKWGVRKARESGNVKALGRQYRKAQKKLAKLEARANNGKKYAKRAAALGAGAAAAGGLAAAGTGGVANALSRGGRALGRGMSGAAKGLDRLSRGGLTAFNNFSNMRIQAANLRGDQNAVKRWQAAQLAASKTSVAGRNAAKSVEGAGRSVRTAGTTSGRAVRAWGNSTSVADKVGGRLKGVSNNTIARAGAAALGAGLAGGAAYNAYRAATTKRAARKAAQFRNEMNKAFAGTQYDRRRKKNRRG